ncbi:PREDICTED: kinesin-like protein KIN-14I isoform X2 [Lupinus angustifolius]|uniref:kinesin-like protein KIN-14I isoform X2 n=1 Tax=Lupinus angustifolius TaxID=3871 RepID=UPI00092E55A5|nr:PREDICTED: kinesin-like protein KIN-14I isoform X2 [Lupinus angustifolius]
MATEQVLPFSVISVVEDVLQNHGRRLSDVNLASRKAEETSLRRYEAAGWLRKTVGVVGGKDLPAEPSEEDFRLGLRSGIILCNVLNKVQPGAVSKVVEAPNDSVLIPDGAALSAYQYFENVRNFLVALEEVGLPTFEASDLEQGGKSSRVVNCVLALKSYAEWKQGGKLGTWKYGGIGSSKPPTSGKQLMRKNSEPFMKSLWTPTPSVDRDAMSDHSSYSDSGLEHNEGGSFPFLHSLVREYLCDKRPEEIPTVVESLLGKVMEEFERRMQIQHETLKITQDEKPPSELECSISKATSVDEEMEEKEDAQDLQVKEELEEESYDTKNDHDESSSQNLKKQELVQQQNRSIQELKTIVYETKSGMEFLQKKYQEEIIYLSKHLHSLASAASGYHKVLEENRKLYNQVQDLKGNIRVYCRVRPFLGGQPSHYSSVSNVEEGNISILTPSKYGKEGKKIFNFNRAFGPSATQAEVFSDMQPLIRSVLDGYNVCIFAYGQTGSGKTHTMSGPDELTDETIGVNYRALGDLFLLSEQRKDTICYDINVQMLEIYNEQVRDLLTTDGAIKRLEIRNSSHNGINVPDANLVPVSSTSDVINLMNLGHKNRAVGSTAMNDRSSRSHSCLTVHVQGRYLTSGSTIRGSMHLVDLAGSERADKSEATGDRLKEAQHINKSLSALGDVIASLASKNAHVPYRNSKLTQLLQDSLGGQAKTLMFVHISPEPEALGETLSTLKFAERVSTIELGAARVNKDASSTSNSDVKELKEQIASLKGALARKEGEQVRANSNNHEAPKLKSCGSSPIRFGIQKPRDDSSSLEGQKKAASKLKRRSLDIHDMYRNSPQWPHGANYGTNTKDDDKESSTSSDWNDKIMMKRNDSLTSDDSLVGQWESETKQYSPLLSPSSLSETSKMCIETSSLHGSDMNISDECDELEIATSESSESELNWLSPHIPKPTTISNGLPSKSKKSTTQPKVLRIPEPRTMIPSLIPTPARKYSTVVSQPRKLPGPIDVKRKSGNAK